MSRLYCGTSGWNYNHWRGVFYPQNLPQSKWLQYYCEHFDTVEINNSFYRLPDKSTFEVWAAQSPDGFTFAVKASRYLTHMKKLKDPEESLHNVISRAEGLGNKMGPILYQLPPYWHLNLQRFEEFLESLPKDKRHVFEFRDDTWQCEEVWKLLAEYNAAYCMMASPGLPLHVKSTADFSYIRMHEGEDNGSFSRDQLDWWAEQIDSLLERGDVYIYFNNDAHGYAIENARRISSIVGGR